MREYFSIQLMSTYGGIAFMVGIALGVAIPILLCQ
jgi:hypothetical protein